MASSISSPERDPVGLFADGKTFCWLTIRPMSRAPRQNEAGARAQQEYRGRFGSGDGISVRDRRKLAHAEKVFARTVKNTCSVVARVPLEDPALRIMPKDCTRTVKSRARQASGIKESSSFASQPGTVSGSHTCERIRQNLSRKEVYTKTPAPDFLVLEITRAKWDITAGRDARKLNRGNLISARE